MRRIFDLINSTISKLFVANRFSEEDIMVFFKSEYKQNPAEAYEYWINTGRKNFF